MHSFLPYVEGAFEFIEGIREEEFAPVKNKEGELKDSPTTARWMISKLHSSWIQKSFPDVKFKETPSESFVVELDFMSKPYKLKLKYFINYFNLFYNPDKLIFDKYFITYY